MKFNGSQSSVGCRVIETAFDSFGRHAAPFLLLTALTAVVLGIGVSPVSAEPQAKTNASIDNGNVTDIYEGEVHDGGTAVTDLVATSDGGVLAIQPRSPPGDTRVLRFDETGELLEQGIVDGGLHSLRRVDDDAYVAVGTREEDIFVAWIAKNGTVRWTETYGGDELDMATDVAPAPTGDAYVLASTESFGVETSDLWALRLAPDGEVVWDRRVEHEKWTAFPMGERLADGSLIAAIRTERSMDKTVDGNQNVSVARISPDGAVEWRTLMVGAGEPVDLDEVFEVVPAHGDGVVLLGTSNTGNERWHPDAWAAHMGPDGDVRWHHHYDTPAREGVSSAVRTSDGYLLTGMTQSDDGEPRFGKMIAINEDGTLQFAETYDRAPQLPQVSSQFNGVEWTTDGRLVAGGAAMNQEAEMTRAWIADFSDASGSIEPPPPTREAQNRGSADDGSSSTSAADSSASTSTDASGQNSANASNPTAAEASDSTSTVASPNATATVEPSAMDLVLYAATVVSVGALFFPYGLRRFGRG